MVPPVVKEAVGGTNSDELNTSSLCPLHAFRGIDPTDNLLSVLKLPRDRRKNLKSDEAKTNEESFRVE